MPCGEPSLNHRQECLGVNQELVRLCAGRDCGSGVVDLVPLAPTGVEVIRQLCRGCAERQLYAFKGDPMMTGNARYAIAGTCDRHLGDLKCGIICSCKAPVLREGRNSRVSEIACDEAAYVVEFLNAGPVRVNLSGS